MKKAKLLLILIVCIILCGCNKNPSNNVTNGNNENTNIINTKLNEELKNTISFAIKNEENLIAITSDGKEVTVYDGRYGNKFYYYYDNDSAIYLSIIDGEKKNVVGKIDLAKGNNTYDLEVLFSKKLDNYSPAYITKIGNKLYLALMELYEYNLDTKEFNKLGIKSPKRYMSIAVLDNILYYHTMDGVYAYNVDTKETKEITKDGSVAYTYKDKFIYYYDGGTNGEYDESKDLSYYLYDPKTNDKTRITELFGMQTLDKEYVIPFDNKFYSFNYFTLKEFDGNQIKDAYTFSCDDFKDTIKDCEPYSLGSINEIVKVSNDTLWIEFGNEMDAIFYYYTFNLNTKKITKVDSADSYSSIQYVY